MSKELTTGQDRNKLIQVLQSSLYVGAKPQSIEMVLGYCEAVGLDPMQKPVHIVPISAKDPVSGRYEWRDVVMPGIGLYRIQADRSGNMAGITEPEFGPDVTQTFTDKNGNQVTVSFPEWCRVSAKKLVGDHIVDFTAKEYWIENYATDSGKSDAPNAMWRKRPRGQLAKCAEAQALRKGWPEIGSAPTAEEMEGKTIDMGSAERVDRPTEAAALPYYPADKFEANFGQWLAGVQAGKVTVDGLLAKVGSAYQLTQDQLEQVEALRDAEPPLQGEVA